MFGSYYFPHLSPSWVGLVGAEAAGRVAAAGGALAEFLRELALGARRGRRPARADLRLDVLAHPSEPPNIPAQQRERYRVQVLGVRRRVLLRDRRNVHLKHNILD